ncbi:MAG TPA: zinc-binding dehydrogenase [Acetobacteraceae bacterium]|nr:zinc-binding dehydrogenase [Acetobacteraceae bacterium]
MTPAGSGRSSSAGLRRERRCQPAGRGSDPPEGTRDAGRSFRVRYVCVLGAHDYIDSKEGDVAQALRKMGGARAIIATVTSPDAMQAIVDGLGANGVLMVIGAVGTFPVDTLGLLFKRAAVKGWYSGVAADSEDTLAFSQLNGVGSMNEIFPFEEAQAAYDRMMSGKARFRVVLKMH